MVDYLSIIIRATNMGEDYFKIRFLKIYLFLLFFYLIILFIYLFCYRGGGNIWQGENTDIQKYMDNLND